MTARQERRLAALTVIWPPPAPPLRCAVWDLSGLSPDERLELDVLLAVGGEGRDLSAYTDDEIDRLAAYAERCQG